MILALILACAPGFLRSPEGREPLRAAWYAPQGAGSPTLLLLSNSYLLCELPELEDPAEVEALLARQQAGFAREGAAVLFFELDAEAGDLVGVYDVDTTPEDADARRMAVTWWHVVEAVVEARDGVIVSYAAGSTLGDFEYVPLVPEPATLEIAREEDGVEGSFEIGSLDLSGSFTAAACAPDASLFAALAF